ncbi:sigma-70 family RNA polymerase sigma factor [Olivibacter sp. SDN3]|uniref:RNA polymerase sigma factor n=1 Tax=Olivibacter sp. SDN3 TaxID=2764720 RepID=UPI0016516B18|nr:sigma-70 family RNA polymerase sigma factor [Olivibacter sp. SDN3]QNL49153.1 sigma-70 family RNA polymerase sigma factor [Olivibacter sp. SDN3]
MPNTNQEDAILLRRLSENDYQAFQAIYEKYWKMCYWKVVEKSGNELLAEEITQKIFISLWEKREQQNIQHLPSYLHAAIKFQFINHIRAQLHLERYTANQQEQTLVDNSVEDQLNYNCLAGAIEEGIAKLPVKTKEIFELSRMEAFSIKEIAQRLKLSEKAVEYHITKSLKSLRVSLKDYLLVCVTVFSFFLKFIFRV